MSNETRSIIGVFKDSSALERTIKQLKSWSLERRLSVISKSDVDEISDLIDTAAEAKTAAGAGIGATAGTLVGLVGGIGMIVPVVGMGSVLAAGLIGSVSGASIGTYLGAIYSARFAEESKYDIQEALMAGACLLIVNAEELDEGKISEITAFVKDQQAEMVDVATVNFESLDV